MAALPARAPENSMGIGFRELLVILVIALVIFGAKRLKTVGSTSARPSAASRKP
jgi:TatA/E family protein of Tat protein translocase